MNLTLKQKLTYGLGAVGKDMVYALSANYVMFYYQDTLHLSATFVGLILMIACIRKDVKTISQLWDPNADPRPIRIDEKNTDNKEIIES